ncbi:hypothetical protein C789_5391 [Microcystis aeruginosa FACHB-905 = DIANCHI905]|uniref:Uncharacterized protein n=1 Tax=Microcystis aeruginosa PCC 7806SL TaxID=1903187 RepID=A0AB33C1R6_MICA7|nr:hypothetical protein BH695_2387 [Microcystis aeruginosa PCC 7806SL]ELS44822.1 hypothetical protein C789_5391 [Microcystis aeruginosa FACHB-905 = DIANCHI905]
MPRSNLSPGTRFDRLESKVWEKNYLFSGTFTDFSRPQPLSEEFISLEEIP